MGRPTVQRTVPALIALLVLVPASAQEVVFERSPYGLLFTEISVGGQPLTAMIDFGDAYTLQLATSFVESHDLDAAPSGKRFQYADAILGGEFLERVQVCHEPEGGNCTSARLPDRMTDPDDEFSRRRGSGSTGQDRPVPSPGRHSRYRGAR